MTSWVIVAVPREDDYVHKISSEKKAHMTLLFLGEHEDDDPAQKEIWEFVEHAAKTTLTPFNLSATHRGELGADGADVVFFEKDGYNYKHISQFRQNLLKNNAIRAAYESAFQYPEWTPHVTLGYPETPANEDDRDYPGFRWMEFNRIEFWTADSEGYSVLLEEPKYERAPDLAMSDPVDEFLAHYGVKGMRWGKRKSRSSSSDGSPKRGITDNKAFKALVFDKDKFRNPQGRKEVTKNLAEIAALAGAYVAVKKGAQWAANNPDKVEKIFRRASNIVNNTKSIGPGYDTVKLVLNNGVWG